MSPGKALLAAVSATLDERWPYRDRGQPLPPGLRLELHPAAWYALLTDHELWKFGRHVHTSLGGDIRDLAEMLGLPAEVTSKMPHGCWRLVIITEEALNGGRLTGELEESK